LLTAFVLWEKFGAKYPMFPSGLKENPRILGLTLLITFISGANFFAALMFWPSQAFNVYGHDPIGVGLRSLPLGLGILVGACIVLVLLSVTRGNIRALMIGSTTVMTIGIATISVGEVHQLHKVWAPLIFAGLGIGGIIVPASIITTIVCPDDLIATVSALTLTIRVVGGSFGYTTYYNVFSAKFKKIAMSQFGPAIAMDVKMPADFDITKAITKVIELTSTSQLDAFRPLVKDSAAWDHVVLEGELAYSKAYKWVYYTSVAYGIIGIIASCFLQK
jgi:hypothetical protein